MGYRYIASPLTIYYKVQFWINFIVEANTMNPDQTAPKNASEPFHEIAQIMKEIGQHIRLWYISDRQSNCFTLL